MARVDLKKVLFLGMKGAKEKFFSDAQSLGFIHFIEPEGKGRRETSKEVSKLSAAIKVLHSLPVLAQVEPEYLSYADRIAGEILELKKEMESSEELVRTNSLEIARIEVYGNFDIAQLESVAKESKRHLRFFCAKKGRFDEEEAPDELIFISSDHGVDYYFAIQKEPVTYDRMVEMKFTRSLKELKQEKRSAQENFQASYAKLKEYHQYRDFLYKAQIYALDKQSLDRSAGSTKGLLDDALFSAQGWVPSNCLEELQKLGQEQGIFFEEVAIQEGEQVPTCLQNSGTSRIGEDLVHIYDTPSVEDKDPSLWVLSAFTLFFAMIVNDAGYGLVYMLAAFYLAYRFRETVGQGKRMLKLATMLSLSCVVWGMLTTQFFGVEIAADNPMRSVSALTWLSKAKGEFYLKQGGDTYKDWIAKFPAVAKAQSGDELWQAMSVEKDGKLVNEVMDGLGKGILLELALLIGIMHLSLSFLRYLGRNWSGIGWILVMVGGYLYFPHYLGEASLVQYALGAPASFGESEGLQLIYGGLGIAVVLAIIQHRLGGLAEIMNLIQVFADVLSYLRLYALGLASGIVAQTINELGGAMPLLIGIVAMALAHTVNMGLGIMSGVIHGLRLNFLEWYHYSFEGGGKPYEPLRLHEVE